MESLPRHRTERRRERGGSCDRRDRRQDLVGVQESVGPWDRGQTPVGVHASHESQAPREAASGMAPRSVRSWTPTRGMGSRGEMGLPLPLRIGRSLPATVLAHRRGPWAAGKMPAPHYNQFAIRRRCGVDAKGGAALRPYDPPPFAIRDSPYFSALRSPLAVFRHSLFAIRHSPYLPTRHSPLATRYSPSFAIRYSLFAVFLRSLLAVFFRW